MNKKSESYYMTDEELVKACVRKSPAAQKVLFDRFSRKMMTICARYADDSLEAQDILQDAFIKVFNSIESFHYEGSLEGWIKRIMINTALDNYRKNKKRKYALELDSEDVQELKEENEIVEGITSKYLLKLVQNLPEGYKVIFNMFAIEGYSHKEIAEELGISINTSKSQYARARAYLQKVLAKSESSWTNER
jgi:RNA polymerase sigma-70 factor (ECF subfamily)